MLSIGKVKRNLALLLLTLLPAGVFAIGGMGPWQYDDDDVGCTGMGMGLGLGMMGSGMMRHGMAPGMDMMMGGGGWMGGRGWKSGHGMMGAMRMLDLSDAQEKSINDIHDKLRKQQWQIEGKMLDAQVQLRDATSGDKPDPKKVGTAFEGISKLQAEMAQAQIAAHNQVQDVLTKEQRDQLKKGWHGFEGMMRGPMAPGRSMMQ